MRTAETSRRRRVAAALVVACAAPLPAACGGESAGAPRDAGGALAAPVETRLLALREGDCIENMRMSLDEPDGGHNGVPKIVAVPCSRPHDGEVLSIRTISEGGWPGSQIVDGEAAGGRLALRARLARAERALDGQDLTLLTFRPTQDRWEFEDQKRIYFVLLYPRPQRTRAPA
jgi:hypothetical protein